MQSAGDKGGAGRIFVRRRVRGLAVHLLACVLALAAVDGRARPAVDTTAGWAEMANTVFEHLGKRDGLPHAIATAIAEDEQGYLWAGTQEGLARWDGYRFRVYPAAPGDPRGLPAGFIRTLGRDTRGRLWIGMDGGGVARYEAAENRFTRFGDSSVVGLSPDAEGGMWAASVTGLLHVRASGRLEQAWPHGGAGPEALPDASITAVLQDRSGSVWIGSASGLVRRFPDGRPGARIDLPGLPPGTTAPVDALYEDTHGRIWIGTDLHGTFVYEPATGTMARPRAYGAADAMLPTDSVTSFAESGPDEIWIGTVTGGIVVADTRTLQTRRILRDRSVPTNLQTNWIWGLHRDRGGQMWVASTEGLSRTRPQQDAIMTLFSSDASNWTDPSVLAVDAAADGRVWLGQHGGLELIDPLRRRMSSITARDAGDRGAPALGYVLAIVHTADDTLYLGAREGLFTRAPGATKLEPLPQPQRGAVRGVTALLLDGRTLWVGGKGDGIWQMDLSTPARALTQPVAANQLTDPEVTVIADGPGDSVWIGTKNGLNFLRKGQPNERILPVANDATTLAAAAVNCLVTDRKGRLWVGTNAGIAVLERRDARGRPVFHRLGLADGLTSENVDQMLLDASGRIWASTDDGLVVIDPQTYAVRALHAAEGVAISTYWTNSGAASPTGELIFGGLGGLTVVRPERLTTWSHSAPVVATDVEVGGRPVTLAPTEGPSLLTVPPEAGGFAVEFSLLDFSAPERIRYAYWLEGYDKSWREVDTKHRSASYTNLAPGRYQLHVKATDRNGGWSDQPLQIDVDIRPAWHQTWWFDVLKGVAALLVVGVVVAVRVRYVQRRSQELEHLVVQRTLQLTELQHQLEELAYSDALTALPNRRMFSDFCRQLIAASERKDDGFALLLIDLDHFKQVNDTLGHDAGDALLVEAARRLRAIARKSDIVARLGGDEFAILLADTVAPDDVDIACRRILDAFDAPVTYEGLEMRISPSIGIALFPLGGRTQDELYKSADLALYEAKRSGRRTWRFAPAK